MYMQKMETLEDWKTALASGVKIETLLGLDQSASQDQSKPGESKENTTNNGGINPLNLSVKTTSGQQLDFQWSSPSRSMISPDVHGRSANKTSQSSLPSDFAVAPPMIKVNEILGPCFIGMAEEREGTPEGEGSSSGEGGIPEKDNKQSPD